MLETRKKAYKGMAMEGFIASWYAKNTAKDLTDIKGCARRVGDHLIAGSRVLEVAPGPGYLAIELARLGPYEIAGLDISRSFVRIAAENAAKAGVTVDFRHGDAASMPFAADAFDFIVCRAAFKNFAEPYTALDEMHRVLRSGGQALIVDMRNDASDADIDNQVRDMKLGRIDALLTRGIFKYALRRRAYSKEDFACMVAQTPFRSCTIVDRSIGMEVWLRKGTV